LQPETGRVEVWRTDHGLTDNRVFATAPAPAGQRWVATWQGLNLLDPETGSVERIVSGLSNNRVIEVFMSSTGTLWAGTMGGGLNRQDPGAEGYEHLGPGNGRLSDGIVASVAQDASGGIWVGTANGLNVLGSPDGTKVLTTRDGLPNNTVYSVVEGADGRMWMATNKGLAALAPASGDIRTFDITDGLQNNEFNQGAVFRTPDGTLLFGGISGVTRFHPESVMRPVDRGVELASLQTDAWSVPPTALPGMASVRVTPEDGALRVGFASADLRNPDRLAFRYRLRSQGDGWTVLPPGDRTVTFPGLSGGTHVLEFGLAGADGPDRPIRQLTLEVIPPFWATGWFRTLAALGILGLTWLAGGAVYRRRLRMVEARERAQTEIHRRLMQSREAERLRLSQELHDGAMQDLYGVRYRLEDETSAMVQDVIAKLREICGELRPSVLTPFGLERAIRAFMDTVADRHPGLAIELDLDADGQSIPEEARLALYRVVQEAVHNVIKHAEASRVRVAFRWNGTDAEVTIEDDGRGFTVPDAWLDLGRAGHYGLLGLSERVRALEGHLHVASKPGAGAQVRVRARITA
jgi:signal transduction histidine kinase